MLPQIILCTLKVHNFGSILLEFADDSSLRKFLQMDIFDVVKVVGVHIPQFIALILY